MKTALTIAGFDPSSGAGITADLMVFAAHGLFGISAITALTVQSTMGVRSMSPVAPELLRETLACLNEDLPPAGIKLGMLGSVKLLEVVAEYLESVRRGKRVVPVMLDPVLVSSSGRALLEEGGVAEMRKRLLPLVDWVTPNTHELALLSGMPVNDASEQREAAETLQAAYPSLGVLATGGHLHPPADLLVDQDGVETIPGEWVETTSTHGTGCTHSSAFLSRLVMGDPPKEAARAAKAYVTGALRAAPVVGHGKGPLAPLWQFRTESGSD